MKKFYLLGILFSIIFSSCSKDPVEDLLDEKDLLNLVDSINNASYENHQLIPIYPSPALFAYDTTKNDSIVFMTTDSYEIINNNDWIYIDEKYMSKNIKYNNYNVYTISIPITFNYNDVGEGNYEYEYIYNNEIEINKKGYITIKSYDYQYVIPVFQLSPKYKLNN